jgi:hypothetical protein
VKVVELLVHGGEWRQLRKPGIRENHVDLPVLLSDLVYRRSRSVRLAASPCTAVTFLPISATARFSASWRRRG